MPQPKDLRQHLVVEHEIIGVGLDRQLFQEIAREGPVPGVIFRQFRPGQNVFCEGKKPV